LSYFTYHFLWDFITFRFVPSKFEEIFNKHAHTHPNALTYDELNELIKANREPKDVKGRLVLGFYIRCME